jgi:hypothetical protein
VSRLRDEITLRDPVGKGTDREVGAKAPVGAVAFQGRALEPYCKVGSTSIDPDLPLNAVRKGGLVFVAEIADP